MDTKLRKEREFWAQHAARMERDYGNGHTVRMRYARGLFCAQYGYVGMLIDENHEYIGPSFHPDYWRADYTARAAYKRLCRYQRLLAQGKRD